MSMMSTPGLIVAAVLVAFAFIVIGYPLLGKQFALGDKARRQRLQDELLMSYERVVATIRDLDEDFNTGKLHENDYAPERQYWAAHGVELLQKLDEIGALDDAPNGSNASGKEEVDDAIEDAVSRYLAEMKNKEHHEPSGVR